MQVYWMGGWVPGQGGANGVALAICFAVDSIGATLATLAGLLV
jgi:hypothetical protein